MHIDLTVYAKDMAIIYGELLDVEFTISIINK